MSALPARILLVDPDPSIRELMADLFADEGFAVTACMSPQQATALLDGNVFDLVITDGFSTRPETIAARTAEVIDKAGLTPVALFTAHVLDAASAQVDGFRDRITKPFDLDDMVSQVKVLLAKVLVQAR